jgi:hypothetical protein
VTRLKRALREPLLHFFALGALVFLYYSWRSSDIDDTESIVVSRGQQTNLIETFEATWGRPPTQHEFVALIDDYLREELAYREGSARELDRNDTVIRRRLRQKLELLAEDLATLAPPTQAELEASYAANAEKFRPDTRYTFEQIDYSSDRRGDGAEADALAQLAALRAGTIRSEDIPGDSRVLAQSLSDVGESEIASIFGESFVDGLASLTQGEWGGPVRSSFGWHLVQVSEKVPGEIPPLGEIADRVQAELLGERRRAALDLLYASLAERYEIRVEPVAEAADGSGQ